MPLVLTGLVVLAQLAPIPAFVELTDSGAAPETRGLVYPLLHIVLAPLTLTADWLNGGSRQELIGFVLWSAVGYVLARLALRTAGRSVWREALYAGLFAAGLVGFFAWAAYAPRPIPRLISNHPDELIWDLHSHTDASHDGRRGFDAAANAAWHREAGFAAAFITDHNALALTPARDVRGWRQTRLLAGTELSLSGLHLIVLGPRAQIANEPANRSWDSTLALIRSLSSPRSTILDPRSVFLVASLPEYWRHHWGTDLRDLVLAGVQGFEIWTSSPTAMEMTPRDRALVIARARALNLPVFGATDMHGIGRTASAWNVMLLNGWRDMSPDTLQAAIISHLFGGYRSNFVVVLGRWVPVTAPGRAFAAPTNVALLAGRGSMFHGLAWIGWIWTVTLVSRRIRRRSP